MATTVKGTRVSQLAKELSVPSKKILDRIKSEGIPNPPTNAQSTVSVGLAATVREWFAAAARAAAAARKEEPHAPSGKEEPADHDHKPRTTRRTTRRKSTDAGETSADEASTEEHEAVEAAEEGHPEPVVEAAGAATPEAEQPAAVEAPAESVPAETVAATAETETAPEATAPAPTEPPPSPAPDAPAAPPAPTPAAPTMRHAPTSVDSRKSTRPTVTIESRNAQPPQPTRKPVTPAPQLLVPAPAKIMGPRLVREEKPDIVAAPRRRSPLPEPSQPSFIQARPQGGRGVKTDDDDEAERAKKAAGGKASSRSSRRRGLDGRRGEAEAKLKEFSEADLEERRIRLGDARKYAQGLDTHIKKSAGRGQHGPAKSVIERGEPVRIQEPITVRSLAEALGLKTNEIIMRLMRQGSMVKNVNQTLDNAMAENIALGYNIELQVASKLTLEEQLEENFAMQEVDPDNLRPRPPVVAILGHVDHGKTSLLDRIRKANVAAGEAGGITQHIAAWMVNVGEGETAKRVTFIDTPGHQAFTSMRARGANMTDVVVLVVSAAEGVQPQTIESINHARAAEVPIVVALNKIDRVDANPDSVLSQLAGQGLNPVAWGGETEVVPCSAVTGQGINELIEILDYQSQLLDLKSDPTRAARGIVVESRMDEGLGCVATVLVQDGTLRVGDTVLAGQGYGRVRSLTNDRGESIQEAGPSTPVIVAGLSAVPGAGDKLFVVDDLDYARSIAEERQTAVRQQQLAGQNRVTAANLAATIAANESKTINLIIKADVQGSVETLVASVTGQNTDEVKVRVIHSGVGAVSESDVELAIATKTKPTDNRVAIIGFHVVPDDAARALAEHNHIDIKTYRVIYEIFDDLKKSLSGMLEPEVREKLHGHAEIRQVFKYSKVGNIAGCMVTDGHIQRGSKIRLIRDGKIVLEDQSLESLRRLKDDAREVKAGFECGLKIAGFDDIKQGDRVEAYSRETIERTL